MAGVASVQPYSKINHRLAGPILYSSVGLYCMFCAVPESLEESCFPVAELG